MVGTLKISDQCRESRSYQSCPFQILGPFGAMHFFAINTLLSGPSMFLDTNGRFLNFYLLKNLVRHIGLDQLAAAAGATGVEVDPRVIDLFGSKGIAFVSRMARLTANFGKSLVGWLGVAVVACLGLRTM